MDYYIRALSSGSIIEQDISTDKYLSIKSIVEKLNAAFSIEEHYSFFLKSYIAYEEVIVKKMLESIVHDQLSWADFIEDVQDINISIVNHMTMFKSYLDCVPQQLNRIDQQSDAALSFSNKTNEIYDKYIGYRVISALRNHVQHSGLPVYSLTSSMRWENGVCVHRLEPLIYVDELEKNEKFKSSVLKEIKLLGSKLDVRNFVKNNMSAMADLHRFVRNFYDKSSFEYRNVIEEIASDFKSKIGDDKIYHIEILDADDGRFSLVFEKPDMFDYLIKRNKTLTNFESHVFSSLI